MLTEKEEDLVDKLCKEKYTKHGWNMGREFIHIE
jgi:hypothetical protein